MKLSYQHIKSASTKLTINDFWVIENEFGVHWHYHPEIEICYIKQGSGHRIVGDSVKSFTDGDLVLVGSNLPHCWITDKLFNESDKNIEVFVIQFTADIFSLNVEELKRLHDFLMLAQRGLSFDINQSPELVEKLLLIEASDDMNKYINLLQLLLNMKEGNAFSMLTTPNYTIQASDKAEHRITLVCNYIQQHYNKAISLEELAKLAAMNTSSFSRFFKSKIGKSPINYLNEVRMNNACTNLVNTKDKVYKIAYDVGFHSVAHFNKLFLNYKGQTPKAYRNSILK
ncbi:MAG: AraC family transcriptional regulator [Bacteroidota bacterium]